MQLCKLMECIEKKHLFNHFGEIDVILNMAYPKVKILTVYYAILLSRERRLNILQSISFLTFLIR